jgi:hypothetical protein
MLRECSHPFDTVNYGTVSRTWSLPSVLTVFLCLQVLFGFLVMYGIALSLCALMPPFLGLVYFLGFVVGVGMGAYCEQLHLSRRMPRVCQTRWLVLSVAALL